MAPKHNLKGSTCDISHLRVEMSLEHACYCSGVGDALHNPRNSAWYWKMQSWCLMSEGEARTLKMRSEDGRYARCCVWGGRALNTYITPPAREIQSVIGKCDAHMIRILNMQRRGDASLSRVLDEQRQGDTSPSRVATARRIPLRRNLQMVGM
jgi:hypothetical protein